MKLLTDQKYFPRWNIDKS